MSSAVVDRSAPGRRRGWRDLRVGAKITIAVLVALAVSSAATVTALIQLGHVRSIGQDIYTGNVRPMVVASDLRDVPAAAAGPERVGLLKPGTQDIKDKVEDIRADLGKLGDLLAQYRSQAADPAAHATRSAQELAHLAGGLNTAVSRFRV